jgi:reverse transcriptase-like protein
MRIPRIRDEELTTACEWVRADAEDDFCPDYVRYADYESISSAHLASLRTACLRPDMHQLARLVVPRPASMLSRETSWLPFPLRVSYMLLLRRLLQALRSCLNPSCCSSQLGDWDGRAYPWRRGHGVSAWAEFINNYREVLIGHGSEGFAIATDITAFYEHIDIGDFLSVLRAALHDKASDVTDELVALEVLLQTASYKGRGLPQNMDPSRLLADVYLRVVDDRVCAIPGLNYLRYVDDIRLVAATRGAVVRGLQRVESQLKAAGLFLNSKKTELIDAKGEEWTRAQEADHDFRLARCDELLREATEAAIEECVQVAAAELTAAAAKRDDSRLRAYGNRLLRAAEFAGVRARVASQLERAAIDGFRVAPGSAETWARFAAPVLSEEGCRELLTMLRGHDHNSYSWTNMWMIIALARCPEPPGEAMDTLRSIALAQGEPEYLRGWAAVAFARHGDGLQRREMVDVCLAGWGSAFLRRATVVAGQQLPAGTKADIRAQTISRDPGLSLLWEYLERRTAYDWYVTPSREFAGPGSKSDEAPSFLATGLVDGRPQRFRAYSRGSDYEVG